MRKSKYEVLLNKDIREYSDRPLLGLTIRQFVFGLLGIAAGAVICFLSMEPLGATPAAFLCTVVALPLTAFGFYKWHGLPLETAIKIWIRSNIMTPRFLPYRPQEPECLKIARNKNKSKEERSNNHEQAGKT